MRGREPAQRVGDHRVSTVDELLHIPKICPFGGEGKRRDRKTSAPAAVRGLLVAVGLALRAYL
ncbi:hypothetical protein GCM10027187_69980 [Streptosporangium sandarakinum]